MDDVVLHGERHPRIAAVNRARRCEHKMFDVGMSAAFEDVQKPCKVAVGVRMGIRERVADTGLGSEMHDAAYWIAIKHGRNGGAIRKVDSFKLKCRKGSQAREPRFFQPHVIVRVEVVEPEDLITTLEQPL